MENLSKAKQITIIILICMIPLFVNTACYKSGVDVASSADYSSCIGCGGLTGFGLNSACWPTEKESITFNGKDKNSKIYGEITYYNDFGCIKNSEVKSVGVYSEKVGCMGHDIDCGGEKYIEHNEGEEYAYQSTSCLGCEGTKQMVPSKHLNESIPRAFPTGCY